MKSKRRAKRQPPPPKPSRSETPRRRILGVCGLIALAAVGAYSNTMSVPFLFDDRESILDNPTILHLWPIWETLSPPVEGGMTVGGRPLLNLSLAVNDALSGTNVWSYHALNLLIHVLVGWLLFGIVRRTFLQPVLRNRFAGASLGLAAATALIWTLHPLQTAAVTYTVQRAESLCGLFYLLTLYAFVRGVETGASNRWLYLSVFACFGGMASKEVMVSAPLIVLLYDRTFAAGTFRDAWRRRRRYYAALALTWCLLAWLTIGSGGRGGSAGFGTDIAWWKYALTQFHAVVMYLKLSVWPHPLVFDYGTYVVSRWTEVAPQALVVLALLTATLVALVRRPVLGFLGAWFFATLAPSSSVVPVATQTMAEHRMYLPLAAAIALVTTAVHLRVRRASLPVFAAMALACGLLAFARNRDYRDEPTVWRDTIAKRPENPRAYTALGIALSREETSDEAVECFERTLEIDPEYALARRHYGFALGRKGRSREAIENYEIALRNYPNPRPGARELLAILNDMAEIHRRLGEPEKALERYEQALTLDPGIKEIQNNVGLLLQQVGRDEEAASHFQRAIELDPGWELPYRNLGRYWKRTDDPEKAMEVCRQALRANPGFVNVRWDLARTLVEVGRVPEALDEYSEILRRAPDRTEIAKEAEAIRQRVAQIERGG